MSRGYEVLEVRVTDDGLDVRFPPARYEYDDRAHDGISADVRKLTPLARGVVRIDLTALEWVPARTVAQIVRLWRESRDRARVVLVVSAAAAFYFQLSHLNRVFEVWAVDPACILARV
jgi:hypothetical protein